MLWLSLVEEHFDAAVKVRTDENMTAATLCSLLDDRINGNSACVRRTLGVLLFVLVLQLFPRLDLLDYTIGIGRKYCASDDCVVSLEQDEEL